MTSFFRGVEIGVGGIRLGGAFGGEFLAPGGGSG